MLETPNPTDWINWRRTQDAWGFSPLNQINKQNVGRLQLAWSWVMAQGDNESGPLVYDGVMYLPNPRGVVQALDAPLEISSGNWKAMAYSPDTQASTSRCTMMFKAFLSRMPFGQNIAIPVGAVQPPRFFSRSLFLMAGKPLSPAGNALFVFALP